MRKVIAWQIWYDDGSTFHSQDGPAEAAPVDGIQSILESYDNGTDQIHEGHDYYYWMGTAWACGYLNDLERWLRKELPALKYGRFTAPAVFEKMIEEVRNGRRQG